MADDWWDHLYNDDQEPASVAGGGRLPDWRNGPINLDTDTKTADTEPATPDTQEAHDTPDQPQQDGEPAAETEPRRTPKTPTPRIEDFRISQLRRILQRAVLLNTPAAAAGAWTYGAFTADWSTGIPQTVLGWMHDAATTSTSPLTPLIIGGLVTAGAAVIGGGIYGRLAAFTAHTPALSTALHWLIVRIPVASSTTALLLYTTT
jgi:hypothetical protein